MRRTFLLLSLLLLAVMAAVPAFAVTQGRVMGVVTDENGNPLQGVTVTVTTPELSNYEEIYVTKKKGSFTAVFVDATRSYMFKFHKDGHQPLEQSIKPTPGENLKMEFVLPTYQAPPPVETTEVPTGAAARALTPAQRVFNEGVQASQDGDKDTALAKFQEAAEMEPDLMQAHLALAGLYLEKGRNEEAAAAVERALEIEPGDVRAMEIAYEAHVALGNSAKADEYLSALSTSGINVAARLFNTGVSALNLGDYATAAKKFRQAIEEDPELTPAYSALAVVLLGLEEFDEALEAAEQALRRDPGDDRAKRMRYQSLRFLGRTDEAQAAFDSLNAKDQGVILDDLYNEATESFNAGDTAEAAEILEGVVAADPNHGKAHYLLGLSYTNLGDTAKAKMHLEQFLQVAPNDPDAATAQEMLKYLGGS